VKSHHSALLQKPIEQHGDIAVAGEYLRIVPNLVAQVRKDLNRAETAAGAKDRVDVAAAKKGNQVPRPRCRVSRQVPFAFPRGRRELDLEPPIAAAPASNASSSTQPAGATTPILLPGLSTGGLCTATQLIPRRPYGFGPARFHSLWITPLRIPRVVRAMHVQVVILSKKPWIYKKLSSVFRSP
jgi:hypothetical protein